MSIKNQLIIFLALFFASCSNGSSDYSLVTENENENFDIKIYKKDGIPEHMILEYFKGTDKLARRYFKDNGEMYGIDSIFNEDGSVQIVREYIDGKLDGDIVGLYPNGDTLSFQKFDKGVLEFQKVVFPNGKFASITENNVRRTYYLLGKPEIFSKKLDNDSIYGYIKFDEQGEVVKAFGKLDFLNYEDSLLLDKWYPGWKEKIR